MGRYSTPYFSYKKASKIRHFVIPTRAAADLVIFESYLKVIG